MHFSFRFLSPFFVVIALCLTPTEQAFFKPFSVQDFSKQALIEPFTLGDFNGTVLSDGVLTVCRNPYKVSDALFERAMLRSRSRVYPHTLGENVVVIDINGYRVMVDTGYFTPPGLKQEEISKDAGKLMVAMRQAGITPASIDAILITHGHFDHVMGLVSPTGKKAFPNALVYISRIDHEFWLNPTKDTELSLSALRVVKRTYSRAIKLYRKRLVLLEDMDSPIPGIKMRLTPGHSPGHAVFEFHKGKSRLVVAGDLFPFRELQVTNTHIGFEFDTNSTKAGHSRRKLFRLVVNRGDLVLNYHENFPGLGYIRRFKTNGFEWVFASLNDFQPRTLQKCPAKKK